MAAARTCPSCSSPLDAGVTFCQECGSKVPLGAGQAKAPAKHTMLGVSPEALAQLTQAAKAAAASAAAAAASTRTEPEPDAGRTTEAGISEPPRGQMG